MTFNQILDIAKQDVEQDYKGFRITPLKLIVNNKRELGQLKRALTKYQKECQSLINNDNFDMSEYENYISKCKYINKAFENALILV